MPNWKKVIVSGSDASLNSLSVGDTSVTGSLNVYKSGSTVFSVEGSQGTLFSITDSLSGSLFSVGDISGVPILEVFSDDTVKLGTFGNEAIVVNGDTAVISGSFTGTFSGVPAPVQLVTDCKGISQGYLSWYGVSDLQGTVNQGYAVWIAPTAGYLEDVNVSPEQPNPTTANGQLTFYKNGTLVGSTITQAMGAAGTNKRFTFGSTYSFAAGDRISLNWNKNTNSSDLYSMMVHFKLDS
jgi:hypothetical protein